MFNYAISKCELISFPISEELISFHAEEGRRVKS